MALTPTPEHFLTAPRRLARVFRLREFASLQLLLRPRTAAIRTLLSWTLDDESLGHLLWTGTRGGTHGLVGAFLEPSALSERLAQLLLFLGQLAIGVPKTSRNTDFNSHPVVLRDVQMLEAQPFRQWSLTELTDALHVAPSYLSRLFRQQLGLPPMAYLAHWRAERLGQSELQLEALQTALRGQCQRVPCSAGSKRLMDVKTEDLLESRL